MKIKIEPKPTAQFDKSGSETLTNQEVMSDFKTFGYLFKSLCIRDLRVYADAIDGSVYHYRDQQNSSSVVFDGTYRDGICVSNEERRMGSTNWMFERLGDAEITKV